MMTASDFVAKAYNILEGYNTVYALGMFGQPINKDTIAEKKNQLPGWYTSAKCKELEKLIGQAYYGFDCVCLIKAILWGFPNAKYCSNGVSDFGSDADGQLTYESTNFSNIEAGEVVLMEGHIGIYVGNGKVIESSPKWKNGVQLTGCGNVGNISGLNSRIWKSHGKLKYIDYSVKPPNDTFFKEGVKKLQIYLNNNYKSQIAPITGILSVDGGCGNKTKKASAVAMQVELNKLGCKLAIDGSCGSKTAAAMSKNMVVKGTKGARAYLIQGLLYGSKFDANGFDGSIGAGCDKAIKAYQSSRGLEADGKVGGQTFKKLTD